MVCDYSLKLQTITDPFSGSKEFLSKLVAQVEQNPILNRFKSLPGYDS